MPSRAQSVSASFRLWSLECRDGIATPSGIWTEGLGGDAGTNRRSRCRRSHPVTLARVRPCAHNPSIRARCRPDDPIPYRSIRHGGDRRDGPHGPACILWLNQQHTSTCGCTAYRPVGPSDEERPIEGQIIHPTDLVREQNGDVPGLCDQTGALHALRGLTGVIWRG